MKIEISADSRSGGSATDTAEYKEVVESGLARFQDRLTRVEIHLADLNGHRRGVDRRCLIEARPASMQPVSVEHVAESDAEAIRGAVDKMQRRLSTLFDRRDDRRGESASGLQT